MSCNIKLNTKLFLEDRNIIDANLNIINKREFKEVQKVLDDLAWHKYIIKGPSSHHLIEGDKKVIFNDDYFNALDIAIDQYDDVMVRHINRRLKDASGNIKKQRQIRDDAQTNYFSNDFDEYIRQEVEEIKRTPIEYVLFGSADVNTKHAVSGSDVLRKIRENYQGFSDKAEFLLDNIEKIISKTNVIVSMETKNALATISSEDAFMAYDPKDNVIHVSPKKIREAEENGDPDFVVHAFLHEVVHSLTIDAYSRPKNVKEEMFRDFINAEYKHYLQFDDQLGNPYGLTVPEEFIAEIYSNQEFREQIENLPTLDGRKSMFERFTDWVRRLLGLQNTKEHNHIVQEILNVARPTEYSGANFESKVFNIIRKEKEELTSEELTIDDSTLEKRLINTVQKLTVSLDASIKGLKRRLDGNTNTFKDSYYQEQIKTLEAVKKDLTDINVGNQIIAIEGFVNAMIGNMEVIKKAVSRVDVTDEQYILNAVKSYDKVLSAYSIIDDVIEMISAIEVEPNQNFVTAAELAKLRLYAENASGRYATVRGTVEELMKKAMIHKLNHVKYFKEVETKHVNRLVKEHKESGILEDRDQWVIKTMANRDKQRIDEDVLEAVTKLINNKAWDIYGSDVTFSSGINVSSPLIQVFHQLLTEINQVRNKERVEKDVEFEDLYKRLREAKGTNNVKKLYENILQTDSDGKYHLKGEYDVKFLSEVYNKIRQLRYDLTQERDRLNAEMAKHVVNSPEYLKYQLEYKNIVTSTKNKIKKLEANNTIKADNGKLIIHPKWKNDLSNLSEIEKEVLKYFTDLQDEIQKMTYPSEAEMNIRYAYKGIFYELPKITKSDTERFFEGDVKGLVTDKITDVKKLRPDDFGYTERFTDLAGRKVRALKLWYRDPSGSFKNSDQSLDLMGIMRMDFVNASAHQIRGQFEQELNFLLDIATAKEYNRKEGTIPVVSKLFKKYDVVSGANSNTVAMMNNMLESQFYDILNKGGARIGSIDANKAVTFINNASAFLTLSLNLASGTANVLNANAQLFIESFGKGKYITAASIAKANKIYGATLGDSLADITRPVHRSFVNQLQEYFNSKGLHELAETNFVQTDLLKAGFSAESLRVFQESGEHYIQSVTVMAVLDNIKVMDENHNFLNKKGTIVKTKKAAASLLDMMEVDKTIGTVDLNSKVVYTTHSKLVKWNEGGKENVDSLVAKKLYDIIGNYRASDQPDVTRSWHGKLIMLYRKFLVPMGQARLRGIETVNTRKENLEEYEKRYSYALQEYEEGYYTTFLRYVITSAKDKKMYLMTKDKVWDKLSDYEKHNIKKFVVESVMTMAMLPLLVQLVVSLQGNDDDDYIYFLLYQIRRLDTELSSYKNPSESFKMMRSPIPSLRLIETSMSLVFGAFQPWKWSNEYANGHNKGKNKYWTTVKKQIPVVKEFQRTYKDLFEYQNSYFGFK